MSTSCLRLSNRPGTTINHLYQNPILTKLHEVTPSEKEIKDNEVKHLSVKARSYEFNQSNIKLPLAVQKALTTRRRTITFAHKQDSRWRVPVGSRSLCPVYLAPLHPLRPLLPTALRNYQLDPPLRSQYATPTTSIDTWLYCMSLANFDRLQIEFWTTAEGAFEQNDWVLRSQKLGLLSYLV